MVTTRRFDWLLRPRPELSTQPRFAEVLAELPAVERSALALSEIGGLDTSEIAYRLGTDPAVVRKLLFHARESVRGSLTAHGRRGLVAAAPFQSLWRAQEPAVGGVRMRTGLPSEAAWN